MFSARNRRAENVIDAPVVDRCISGSLSEIAKGAKDMAVRFTIVLYVIGVEVCFVSGLEFEVKVSGDKGGFRLRVSLDPIDEIFRVPPPARRIKSIGMGTQKNDGRSVVTKVSCLAVTRT